MPATRDQLATAEVFSPLACFYKRPAQPPEGAFIDGEEMPQPQRRLLVHCLDMTPMLAGFYGEPMALRVLDATRTERLLIRKVVLFGTETGVRAEYGGIRIDLPSLPSPAREAVVEGEEPLGGILKRLDLPHQSRPQGYFSILADDEVGPALGNEPGTRLFGRCNQLALSDGTIFAEVVEILPDNGVSESRSRT
ncbi:MAG: hypothetical protein AAF514_22885 [Verrucomicrobiota bacterium]